MRVFYKKTILEGLQEVMEKAKSEKRTVQHIILNNTEWGQFERETVGEYKFETTTVFIEGLCVVHREGSV